jgi:hypothetical protein
MANQSVGADFLQKSAKAKPIKTFSMQYERKRGTIREVTIISQSDI